tara:strand:- start:284 stop:502 length:219 start_codon:yes stop_codon:yes gene_type:complete
MHEVKPHWHTIRFGTIRGYQDIQVERKAATWRIAKAIHLADVGAVLVINPEGTQPRVHTITHPIIKNRSSNK